MQISLQTQISWQLSNELIKQAVNISSDSFQHR